MEALIIGAGFAGAVCARRLADRGYTVTLLEKRAHIAGNMYDGPDDLGIRVHWYGPHIFHTSSRRVWDYLCRYARFFPYEHRVLGRIDGRLVPIPFNFTSLEKLLPEQAAALERQLSAAFPKQDRISILELLSRPEDSLRELGEYIYDRVFVHYTAKQWQLPIEQVDRSVINRVPVVLGYDDRYFRDTWQAMPEEGYLPLFQKLLEGVEVRLNCDAMAHLELAEGCIRLDGQERRGPVIYTGALDELFGRQYGPLPYRSLDLSTECRSQEWFQPAAVVNYPNEEAFTRITEFKYLTRQQIPNGTTIMKEYPLSYRPEDGSIPYYPIASPENEALYQRYRALAEGYPELYLCGRLAEYRYYNMDGVIERALELCDSIG